MRIATLCLLFLSLSVAVGAESTAEPDRAKKDAPTPITLGDSLPGIGERATWIQGDAVPEFKPGQVYVIDLWATWCGPCIQAIPETDDVSRKLSSKGVTVIGVALDPKGATPTAEFVEGRDDMSYAICEVSDESLLTDYMARTGTAGIPTIMIVDREGRLAWKGHPNEMRVPLYEIVLDIYDLDAAKEYAQERASERQKRRAARGRGTASRGDRKAAGRGGGNPRDNAHLMAALRDDDHAEVLELIEPMLVDAGDRKVNFLGMKFKALWQLGRVDDALALGKEIQATEGHFKPQVLCGAARFLLEQSDRTDMALNQRRAMKFIDAAYEAKGQRWPVAGLHLLALEIVEDRLDAVGDAAGSEADREYLQQRLKDLADLQAKKPSASAWANQLRAKMLGNRR